MTVTEYTQAIQDFHLFMRLIKSPPDGEGALVLRAEEMRGTYTCRWSADGIYIALAEALSDTHSTVLLTFDEDMSKQAARNAPRVHLHLLTV